MVVAVAPVFHDRCSPRLLVVDDDQAVLSAIETIAKGCRYEVMALGAASGFAEALRVFKPSLVICSVTLEGLDGGRLVHSLIRARCTAKVAILGPLSAPEVKAAVRRGRECGLDMVRPITKPVDEQSLSQWLTQIRAGFREITSEELLQAFAGGQLEIRYQPKVSLQTPTRQIMGVEALVRWRHPSRGLLSASQFLPAAEAHGLIEPMSSWILSRVLNQLSLWKGRRPFKVAVNLPAALCEDVGFPARLKTMMAAEATPPEDLILEIAERVALKGGVDSTMVFQELRLVGIGLSVDDFGGDRSSIAELCRIPVDEIKIDAAFVLDMISSGEARAAVEAMVRAGHEFGLEICAEGVESEDVLESLQAIGCDKAQGFLFGKALTVGELEPFDLGARRG